MKIPFNRPYIVGKELEYIAQAFKSMHISGDGSFTQMCHEWLQGNLPCRKALLSVSGTAALEIAAILSEVKEGDEVIMPSYTFPSTANAFVLRGARVVFVDVRPDTMNIDEKQIEKAVTDKTKVIVPVHYAGISCDMDTILEIADKYKLMVIEDAAQGFIADYKGSRLGTLGDIGCFSFHETKNISCGEGGAIILNEGKFIERAEIIREKGTDRSKFFRGEIDKYSWVDVGSSYLPSELNAAFLYAQLEKASTITEDRVKTWHKYYEGLYALSERGLVELPFIPEGCKINGQIFYIKVADLNERNNVIHHLRKNYINAIFHFIPLHTSIAGERYGHFSGEDRNTTKDSERLLRLPLFNGITDEELNYVVKNLCEYFNG